MSSEITSLNPVQGIIGISGSFDYLTSLEEAKQVADDVGYPVVLIKAAKGGGGKGIRVVATPHQMERALREANLEAISAFGQNELYIEKFMTNVRHIEVQVLGDKFGNMVHLGERACSIQCNNQKLVEESPSVAVDEEFRGKIRATAMHVAQLINYYSSGTVEFLLDRYYLEIL